VATMKLHFEPDLDYQLQAIEAVADLFRGQETHRSEFTVTRKALSLELDLDDDSLGVGNPKALLDDDLLRNLREVQLRHGLRQDDVLRSRDFTVEMETGTGKTYVYLRTIFELNRQYGFTKFVIVVPSIAIKEGVYKSLQIMEDHFRGLYAGVPFDFFLYDSGRLGEVRNFATSQHIQIMVVTVGAINKKDVNNLYKDSEKTGGERPIDLIRATHPVLVVDEPQSVDGGLKGRGKEALEEMNPLATVRYSATHVDKHHMVYKLDAVDAYERKLVKQIEVASATLENAHNRAFVRLERIDSSGGGVSARVTLDVDRNGTVSRKEVVVYDGDDLEQVTGRAVYSGYQVGEIRAGRENPFMELRKPGGEEFLTPGKATGDVDPLGLTREMIRRTIKEHLDKERRLRPRGIKVLSLFFIDQVAKYRIYDEDGEPQKGVYARIFEEEYRRAAKHPDYRTLFEEVDLSRDPGEVHDGYFSIDKKGGWTDTAENNQTNRDNAERAYNLIMRDKERLLSLDEPLKFIFSHSALREGWDSPNVFQICTLREMGSERERRQSIGRGLRLCVNQEGHRVRGHDVNTLTVVALEGYQEFASNLQKEIEKETGIRFGVVERHQFAGIGVASPEGTLAPLGAARSEELWKALAAKGYISDKGKVQDSLRVAFRDGTFELPEEFAEVAEQAEAILRKLAGRLTIRDADARHRVVVRKQVLESPEFKALWERIRDKTTYRVKFDNAALISECVRRIQQAPAIPQTRIQWRKADIEITKGGVDATERGGAQSRTIREDDLPLPDILTELQDRTQLTRRTIRRILVESQKLDQFRRNPQAYIELVSDIVNTEKRRALVDGIRYRRIGDGVYYAQELFESEELSGHLEADLQRVERGLHEHVRYDSEVERTFAQELDRNTDVKVFTKLPDWFKVPTPLGTYNPDWAVVVDEDGTDKLYLVVESKGTVIEGALRWQEDAKIQCGRAHFEAIAVKENAAEYVVGETLQGVLDAVQR
jgi:type III restriction enzyme